MPLHSVQLVVNLCNRGKQQLCVQNVLTIACIAKYVRLQRKCDCRLLKVFTFDFIEIFVRYHWRQVHVEPFFPCLQFSCILISWKKSFGSFILPVVTTKSRGIKHSRFGEDLTCPGMANAPDFVLTSHFNQTI